MTHLELINKIEARRKELNITIVNLSKLSGLGVRTVNRFLAGEDVKLSTVERLTNLLGLDFAGNEVVSVAQLQRRQAKEKALLMVALVQGTSSLEMQGLEKNTVVTMLKKMEEAFLTGSYRNRLWVS
jgi:transcriptional regulator with XRE-family HTH domain